MRLVEIIIIAKREMEHKMTCRQEQRRNGFTMAHTSYLKTFTGAVCVLLLCGWATAGEGFKDITKPSKDRTISFVRPGLIAEMRVKEGDDIHKGQILAKLDDSAEQVQLKQLKAKAEDMTLIKARQVALDQAEVELELKQDAKKSGAATDLEVLKARLQVDIAKAQLAMAEFERDKVDRLRYEEAKLQLERMKLKSPIDGKVETILVNEGESVDAQTKSVMRVIRIDPMWVEAKVPLSQARRLKTAQTARITFGLGNDKTAMGKIIHIASDADINTILVRVEVPNPSKRLTGETVEVSFPEKNVIRDEKSPPKSKRNPKQAKAKEI